MNPIATILTTKLILALSILSTDVATPITSLTRVGWVYQVDGNSSPLSLVANKTSQLKETPVHAFGSRRLPNPGPRVNARQILKGNPTFRAFSFLDQTLGDPVVFVSLKITLSFRYLSEPPFSTLGSYRLQNSPTTTVPLSSRLYLIGSIELSIARDRYVLDPKIHTDGVGWIKCVRFLNVANSVEVPFSFTINKVRLSLLNLQKPHLTFTRLERHLDTTQTQQPDRHLLFICKVRQDPRVVSNGPMLLKFPLGFFVQFVGVHYLGDTPDRHLSTEVKMIPDGSVDDLVERNLLKQFLLPRHYADLVARKVRRLQRADQRLGLGGVGHQLNFCYDLHLLKYNVFSKLERRSGVSSLP